MRPTPTNPATLILLKVIEQNREAAKSVLCSSDSLHVLPDRMAVGADNN